MGVSVIMPAFNEGSGIAEVLRNLTGSAEFGADIQVVVAANGCTDDTAEQARAFGVQVLELDVASKTAALNAADAIATGSVRVYVDGDTLIDAGLVRALAAAIDEPGVEAAAPRPCVDTSSSSWPVRGYYAVNARLPVFRGRLFGRGVIALSAAARARFDEFPQLIADDMFLDAVVASHEKVEIDATVRVRAPRRADDLVRRVARAREGNAEFWRFVAAAPHGYPTADAVPGPGRWAWLRRVLLPAPWLLPAAVCYVVIVLLAEATRRSPRWDVRSGWGRPDVVAPGR